MTVSELNHILNSIAVGIPVHIADTDGLCKNIERVEIELIPQAGVTVVLIPHQGIDE